jgi:hypothetical protein
MLLHDTSTSMEEIWGDITWFAKNDDEPTTFTLPMTSAPRNASWRRFAARSSSGDGGSSPVRNAARAWRQECVMNLHSMLCLARLTDPQAGRGIRRTHADARAEWPGQPGAWEHKGWP